MLRKFLDRIEHKILSGPLKKYHPLFDMVDSILYSPLKRTVNNVHVKDGMDYKRMMLIVIYALVPLMLFSFYNVGYQANLVISSGLAQHGETWRDALISVLGFSHDPKSVIDNTFYGFLVFLPLIIVTAVVGGFWEMLFSVVYQHEINEGFLVTMFLFPLVVSPTLPLWQAALAVSFGVVIGKEVFGGTGMNIFNPALLARAFLFFAYPGQISGDTVWVVDGYSMATPLGQLGTAGAFTADSIGSLIKSTNPNDIFASMDSWWRVFWGFIPGSIGETSTFLIIIGALILIFTGIASWEIMISGVLGVIVMSLFLNSLSASFSNPMFVIPWKWHLVLGGFAFGIVYMATDPVSGAATKTGKWIYGFAIGVMCVFIRAFNPGYPEGMMLSILLMNGFAPLIDYFVVERNRARRRLRDAK